MRYTGPGLEDAGRAERAARASVDAGADGIVTGLLWAELGAGLGADGVGLGVQDNAAAAKADAAFPKSQRSSMGCTIRALGRQVEQRRVERCGSVDAPPAR